MSNVPVGVTDWIITMGDAKGYHTSRMSTLIRCVDFPSHLIYLFLFFSFRRNVTNRLWE